MRNAQGAKKAPGPPIGQASGAGACARLHFFPNAARVLQGYQAGVFGVFQALEFDGDVAVVARGFERGEDFPDIQIALRQDRAPQIAPRAGTEPMPAAIEERGIAGSRLRM